jgi:transketolase
MIDPQRLSELSEISAQVRRDIIRMVHKVQSGHPGASLGCADYMTALYFEVMQHNPAFNMSGQAEDVFVLSNGHISPLFYSILARSGYFPIEELETFRLINSRLQGHPATHEGLPGIRVATGSLGQGFSVAAGLAMAKKMNNDPNLVFCLTGDGELQEGQIWECAMFCAHHQVDNLVLTVDWNGQQIDGPNDAVISLGDLKAKWTAFGWHVLEMNGNDMDDVVSTLREARIKTRHQMPIAILMHTEMGYGVDFMQGTHEWHGKAPNDELTKQALDQLPITLGDY